MASVLPVSRAGGSCPVANVRVDFVSVATVRNPYIQYRSSHPNLATTHRFDSGIKASSRAIFQHLFFFKLVLGANIPLRYVPLRYAVHHFFCYVPLRYVPLRYAVHHFFVKPHFRDDPLKNITFRYVTLRSVTWFITSLNSTVVSPWDH